jgi:hypothetical protein
LHSVFDSWTVHRDRIGAHTIQRSLALLIVRTILWRKLGVTLCKIEYPGRNACRLIAPDGRSATPPPVSMLLEVRGHNRLVQGYLSIESLPVKLQNPT